MFYKINFILLFFFIISCQPIELIQPTEFDNSRYEKISFNAKEKTLVIKYNPIFSDENIEDQLSNSPLDIITSWMNENVNNFGSQNKLIINILDASILKKEAENKDAKKYEEQTVFKFEVFFLVEFELYDNSDYLLANISVESSRSTTSQKYISLNETELIINELINKTLYDFVKETKSMSKLYMSEYIN